MKFCPGCGNPLKPLPVEPGGQNKPSQSSGEARRTQPQPRPTVAEQAGEPEEVVQAAKRKKIMIGVLVALIVLVIGLGVAVLLTMTRSGEKADSGSVQESVQSAEQEASQDTAEASDEASDVESETTAEASAEPSPSPSPEVLKTDYSSLLAGLRSQAKLTLVTTDASEYPTMKLYVSLEDESGSGENIILQSPTAGVMESIANGTAIERTVRSVERLEGNVGIGMDIVIDESGSMSSDLSQMQTTLQEFIQSLDYTAGDKGEIIGFNSYIKTLCTYTDNEQNLLTGISNLYAKGGTALYDALYNGITYASYRTGANCVIGFTDGDDTSSARSYQEVIDLAQQKSIPVYLIGFGKVDDDLLRSIAEQTGGSYWPISSISSMNDVLQQIYQVQKDMYCITYETDANADKTADRSVDCVLEEADGSAGGAANTLTFQYVEKYATVQHTSRYEIIKEDISWTEAYQKCIEKGGHLATITSQEEEDTITQMAENAGLTFVWLGGYSDTQDGQNKVIWVTGEDFNSYTNWYPGEPSYNDTGDNEPEYYLMLWYVQNYWSWNDERNDVVNSPYTYFKGNVGYVCEYDDYIGG
jgi:Mg-chelatase subunit ChlD